MGEFQDISRRLSFSPARELTSDEKTNSGLDKYDATLSSPTLDYLENNLVIPALNEATEQTGFERLHKQYNFTVDTNALYLINLDSIYTQLSSFHNCNLYIRYRSGVLVFRFRLTPSAWVIGSGQQWGKPIDQYSSQIILPNFVIEVTNNSEDLTIAHPALNLTTSLKTLPSSIYDSPVSINPLYTIKDELYTPFIATGGKELIPTTNISPLAPWLD